MVSNVLRGRAFAGIGDYSDGKGGRGVVGGGVRKREGLATVATSLQLEFKAIVDAN